MEKKNIIIFKNDAVGDLSQSLDAINNIINYNKNNNITIYLSERSANFDFLLNYENVKIKKVNYDLSLIDKIEIIKFILKHQFLSIYILTPKKFYFYLPVIFRKIKFYALCLNGNNNYRRPSEFLRKYLHKYVVNDRSSIKKRQSTMKIQVNLTADLNFSKKYEINSVPKYTNNSFNKINNYIYFHLKLENFRKLGWGLNDLKMIFNEFLKYNKKVVFTRDINPKYKIDGISSNFNVINFSQNETFNEDLPITLIDEIKGSDLYNLVRNADKVVAFHGMMTNLASIEKRPVLDLFHCEIKSLHDYRRYKNAMYEFKPNYKDYDFIVPSKNLSKTLNKMRFSLKKINE